MKRCRRSPAPSWPLLAGTALAGAVAGIIVAGNTFNLGKRLKEIIHSPYAVGDPAFRRAMSHLLGTPLLPGNRVAAFHNGAEIFPAMLAAIRGARETITFENFVFARGRVVSQFVEALTERARAGVKIHMLQDALGCDCLHGPEMDALERAGVEVEIYRWFNIARMNERTHRKLLIVDGRVGFTGGTGIGDLWLGHGNRPDQWRDSHFRLEGPAVAQMQQAFLDNWMATRGCVLHGDAYFPELHPAGDCLAQVFMSSMDEGSDSTRLLYLLSIAAARRKLQIANAYFVPGPLMIKALLDARRRGVDVEIILPGPLIDQPFLRDVSRACWGPLLRAGVRFYEFQPTNFHCKYFIADGQWASVGSTNLDARSLTFNEEANLNVLDASFGREMEEVFARDRAQSQEITLHDWHHRPLPQKLRGALGSILRGQL